MTNASGRSDGAARAEEPGQVSASPGPPAAPAGRGRRAWRSWQRWRYNRPFWGALLIILGGVEILLSEKAPLPIIIHVGLQGLAGYLVPAIMVLCGLLLLFQPAQQTFYSLLAVLLALGSWITSNLGGFFIGMLLGLTGGALAFAWQRGQRGHAGHHRRPRPRREPSAGLALIGDSSPADSQPGGPPGGGGPREGRLGTSAVLVIPLASLALSVLASPAPTASPTPSPAPTPSPTSTPSPTPSPTSTASPTPSPTSTASPSSAPSPQPTRKHLRHAAAAGSASATPAKLTAGSAALTGLTFDGVAQVPTEGGPVAMLKFSMISLTLSAGVRLLVTQGGQAVLATGAPSLQLSGDVVLFTTKMSASVAGHQFTFTPAKPPAGLRHDVALSNVIVDQPYVSTDSLQAGSYRTGPGAGGGGLVLASRRVE